MRINLTTGEFTEVTITSGTLQNISPQASVEVASTSTKNTGIILPPYATLSYSDNATVYARNAWDDDSTCVIAVEPFKKAGEGGEYTLPIATASKLGGVKIGSNLSIDASGVLSATGGGNPVGTIISFMGTSAPTNYLICDGTTYNITDYQTLADHIAAHFGAVDFFGGDGVDTFAVPDLRGEFLRGTGENSHANQGNGHSVGLHQDATGIPVMQGSNISIGVRYSTTNTSKEILSQYSNVDSSYGSSNLKYGGSATSSLENAGASTYTIRPTNTSVLYCIKYQ